VEDGSPDREMTIVRMACVMTGDFEQECLLQLSAGFNLVSIGEAGSSTS